jgi:type I restriction enzyme R subunit
MDRIELGTQSLKEFRNFADENDAVQATENTHVLIAKLKSSNPSDTLIVTSIQKMSNIKEDGMNEADIVLMTKKRIVFIVDEAHRSTFGEMLGTIKATFSRAIFFGFTGTPIHEENQKKMNTTSTVFGDELHRYSIADGIRDKNVLGFDPYMVLTHTDKDVRKVVALHQAKAKDEAEAIADEQKSKIYYHYMDSSKVKMAGYDENDKYVKGIEDYLPNIQYLRTEHQEMVVKDILHNWLTLSHAGKFHAIFATSSIPEAIAYYKIIKTANMELKITALFDPNIDNTGGVAYKEDGLVEIMEDYNSRYDQQFTLPTHDRFKKDIAARLAHKDAYQRIERTPDQQIDLLIVVDQMLTGFDSKWINTLYLDKILYFEAIIQAFSRTNRLYGPEKPFGTIRYYRKPHTMKRNIDEAVKLYSGDKPVGLFVQKLEENLNMMNRIFGDIRQVFEGAGITTFNKIPDDNPSRSKFASLFKLLNEYLEAAKIQGFHWKQNEYEFKHGRGHKKTVVKLLFDEDIYLILALRYKELFTSTGGGGGGDGEVPYEIDGHLTEIDTGKIDAEFMDSRFDKYLRLVKTPGVSDAHLDEALDELHKSFSTLSQEEQRIANRLLHDYQRGNVTLYEHGQSLHEQIAACQVQEKDEQIQGLAEVLGLDELALRKLMAHSLTEINLNEYGRFDKLKESVDKVKARQYFEELEGSSVSPPKVNIKIDKLLRRFLLEGGFDVE